MFSNCNYIDAILTYDDIIANYPVNVTRVSYLRTEHKTVDIVVLCKNGMTIECLKSLNRKLVVMAEYNKLVIPWLRKNGLSAKVEFVHGCAESYLVNDLCDLCVSVCSSGATIRDNGLYILENLLSTSMYLFVNNNKLDRFNVLLSELNGSSL